MHKVLVLYYSRHGAVASLAKEVGYGIETVDGCEAVMRTVPSVSTVCEATEPAIPEKGDVHARKENLEDCQALVLGSPTRFGTIASPLKYFFDQTASEWLAGTLVDKPAGVFTSSSSMHGGQESTLLSMMLPLIHHGMIVVGIPYTGSPIGNTQTGGTPYGASHVGGPDNIRPVDNDEKMAARILGRRVANCARLVAKSAL
ncbi:MAG: NAD(P)H:quinone oxidoreductase [Gammaproteobacteria bacterium]|nr:NAD(P)H:quinone oxidoreductase [Gammaproteobacteria bacterium]MYJ52039.1 NAD(P)H:quinone oxidoreductase [Gammaproteobacteria bacterium]